jgi:hypothetical protein
LGPPPEVQTLQSTSYSMTTWYATTQATLHMEAKCDLQILLFAAGV